MAVNESAYKSIIHELGLQNVTLVAVSKTKPVSDITDLYELGQRDFGENYVQELVEKHQQLPADIRWHFIGHLQRNKVKEIVSFVYMIHGVDSLKLLIEINKQAVKAKRIVPVLLQIHIAQEETKFGLDETELNEILQRIPELDNVTVNGLMGMASFTDDKNVIASEFRRLKSIYKQLGGDAVFSAEKKENNSADLQHLPLSTLSMGMSSDYKLAVEQGSNMVRIGSLLFGART